MIRYRLKITTLGLYTVNLYTANVTLKHATSNLTLNNINKTIPTNETYCAQNFRK